MDWLGAFSAMSLALAALGIYGVVSYTVAQRRQEIGVRMALGAGRMEIARLLLTQTAWLAVFGVGIGVGLAAPATKALGGALYGVSHLDPRTYGGAGVFLLGVGLGGAVAPIRGGAQVEPRGV